MQKPYVSIRKVGEKIQNTQFIFWLYLLIGVVVGIQNLDSHNNFKIYRQAVFHFFSHQNLYLQYPNEYFDVFLYTPSFAILFVPFAYFPIPVGIILWSIFIVLIYFAGIKSLPIGEKSRAFILLLMLPEVITSARNLQTNTLIAAFIVLSMTLLEKGKYTKAAIFCPLNFFIKGYGAIAGIFFFLKNPKIKTFVLLIIFFLIIALLPLMFYSVDGFILLYQQWFASLRTDYAINVGISVMGVIKSLIYEDVSIKMVQLTGVAIFVATFLMVVFRKNYDELKYYFLGNVLIWIVIFNQSAESPTYVIAATGGFIWYVNSCKTWLDMCLFILFFILTVMSPSDLFPRYIRENYVVPYSLKALPCILIWLKIQFKLMFPDFNPSDAYLWNKKLI